MAPTAEACDKWVEELKKFIGYMRCRSGTVCDSLLLEVLTMICCASHILLSTNRMQVSMAQSFLAIF